MVIIRFLICSSGWEAAQCMLVLNDCDPEWFTFGYMLHELNGNERKLRALLFEAGSLRGLECSERARGLVCGMIGFVPN